MPYSLYRPVGSCSRSGFIATNIEHEIAIALSTSPHISIIFSYPCILVSFIYIAYIIFIISVNRRATTDHAPIAKQPAVPPPAPSSLIGRADTRRERDDGKQATTSQTGTPARANAFP